MLNDKFRTRTLRDSHKKVLFAGIVLYSKNKTIIASVEFLPSSLSSPKPETREFPIHRSFAVFVKGGKNQVKNSLPSYTRDKLVLYMEYLRHFTRDLFFILFAWKISLSVRRTRISTSESGRALVTNENEMFVLYTCVCVCMCVGTLGHNSNARMLTLFSELLLLNFPSYFLVHTYPPSLFFLLIIFFFYSLVNSSLYDVFRGTPVTLIARVHTKEKKSVNYGNYSKSCTSVPGKFI